MSHKLFDTESHKRLAMQVLIVLGLVIFVGGCVVFFYHASLPYVGLEFSGQSVVGAVIPDGPAAAAGLQVGDRILTINNLSPMSSGQIYLRPGDETLLLDVVREGRTLTLMVSPAPPSLATVLNKAGYFLMGFAFWAIAMLVLVFKPRD